MSFFFSLFGDFGDKWHRISRIDPELNEKSHELLFFWKYRYFHIILIMFCKRSRATVRDCTELAWYLEKERSATNAVTPCGGGVAKRSK